VKCLWTDSVRLMSFSLYGDHAWDAYSRSGLTYTLKAMAMVAGSLEMKHLCIRLALTEAALTVGNALSIDRTLSPPNVGSKREFLHFALPFICSLQVIVWALQIWYAD